MLKMNVPHEAVMVSCRALYRVRNLFNLGSGLSKAKVLGKGNREDVSILLFNNTREIQACEIMYS